MIFPSNNSRISSDPAAFRTVFFLFLFYGIANFGHKLIRILRYMRADVIDIEHRACRLISVCFDPGNGIIIRVRKESAQNLSVCLSKIRKRSSLFLFILSSD